MVSAPCLHIDLEGRCFQLAGSPTVSLERRRKLQPLLAALAHQRLGRPGEPLAAATLIGIGWPGERLLPKAARARLHVAISSLRRMGLGGLLRHRDGGYLLAPEAPIAVIGAAAAE